mgnify:FL=1
MSEETDKKEYQQIITQSLSIINGKFKINLENILITRQGKKTSRRIIRIQAAKVARNFLKKARNKQYFLNLLQNLSNHLSTNEREKIEKISKNPYIAKRSCYQNILRRIIEDSIISQSNKNIIK